MSLELYYHPLSSYCHKAMFALYENDTPFTPRFIDLGDEASRAELVKLWPMAQFPVLHDHARGEAVPESSIIIEYLAQHYPGKVELLPKDADAARNVRMADRFIDLHIHAHMQKIVGDRIRPEGAKDPHGVADAERRLGVALGMLEEKMAARQWAMGDAFTMADCAAAPPLFFLERFGKLGARYPNLMAYHGRLQARPSVARAYEGAKPYLSMLPM